MYLCLCARVLTIDGWSFVESPLEAVSIRLSPAATQRYAGLYRGKWRGGEEKLKREME